MRSFKAGEVAVQKSREVAGDLLPQVENDLGGNWAETLTSDTIANIPVNGRDYHEADLLESWSRWIA